MISIVDYGLGNHISVAKILTKLNIEFKIEKNPLKLQDSKKIILPGVGHFGKAMENIKKFDQFNVLNDIALNSKTNILGICLGMQIMTKGSEEGNVEGFAWFNTSCKKFESASDKIPHVGWNTVTINHSSNLISGESFSNQFFYFTHSFYADLTQNETFGKTQYINEFSSILIKKNLIGVQFHPEKSHDAGFQLLKNFVDLYVP